jgi:hypothetical protein
MAGSCGRKTKKSNDGLDEWAKLVADRCVSKVVVHDAEGACFVAIRPQGIGSITFTDLKRIRPAS